MMDRNINTEKPRFKKILGVPTLKTYPIEGMQKGIEIGGGVGTVIGFGLWVYWGHFLCEAGLLLMGGCALAGSFVGFLLGAFIDKVRGKWDS